MKLHPRVTRTAVELVKRFEGLRRRAARLPDGGWTLGYGHTRSAREGAEVTEEEAELLLYFDLSEVATRVEAWTFTSLNQNQFEALTAFAFNIGLDNFRRSTVLKRVNEGQFLQAAAAMELWRRADVEGEGVVVDALVRRRAAEKAHFLTPPEGFKPSPTPVLKPTFDFSVIEAAAQSHAAQRVADIDTPLDGDHALAHLERTAPPPVATPPAVELPTREPVLAESTAEALVLHAPESQADEPSRDAAIEVPPPAAAADPLAAPPVPDAPPRAVFGLGGFEPPPPRFPPPLETRPEPFRPTPAPVFGEPLSNEPALPPDEPESGASLFDQPLRQPLPQIDNIPVERTIRAADEAGSAGPAHGGIGDILKNGVVLFGSMGCLGVLLFALTVTSMLTGPASIAHLAIGLVGVALMTIAGIYFLLKRGGQGEEPMHVLPPRHGAADPYIPTE